jgi:DNA-binding response OmpR family regulator
MDARILLVEDDPEIAGLVHLHLRDEGYAVEQAADGQDGLRLALQARWSLVILDVMLPGLSGLDICRQLREREHRVPILMLTAKSEEIDKVLGLELGADDYLTKPFSIRELLARVKAILRRAQMDAEVGIPAPMPELDYDGLTINLEKRRVALRGKPVELTAKEFDLLALFAGNPGRPFNREQLLNQVWGYSYAGYEHTVNSHINRLRAKIEADPSHPHYIITVWGFGYRFADREEADQ